MSYDVITEQSERVFSILKKIETLTNSLLLFLHSAETKKSKEEIYESWVHQLNEVPSVNYLPMLFKLIENFQNTSLPTELLNICYKQTFCSEEQEEEGSNGQIRILHG